MNTVETKQFMEDHGVVPLKADLTLSEKEAKELLAQLGNSSGSIPFYAIFPAGNPNRPILMDGILTKKRVIDALKEAGPSQGATAAQLGTSNRLAERD